MASAIPRRFQIRNFFAWQLRKPASLNNQWRRQGHRTTSCAGIVWARGSSNNVHFHSVFCLTTGPKPPPKQFLHKVRSRASSFKCEYPLLSLRSSSSFLRLLVTSIFPFIFPSITCFRRQFLHKMWPIQLAFRFLISCRYSSVHWL